MSYGGVLANQAAKIGQMSKGRGSGAMLDASGSFGGQGGIGTAFQSQYIGSNIEACSGCSASFSVRDGTDAVEGSMPPGRPCLPHS